MLSFIKNELDEELYYKYHYDYYIILITTSLDICGEIGNLVYDLKMKGNCTLFNFAKNEKIIDSDISKISNELSELLKNIKKERNEKVHSGVNKHNKFDSIIYWNDLSKYISIEKVKLYNTETDYKVLIVVEEIENTIIKVINSVNVFFDSMLPIIKPVLDFTLEA